MLCNCSIASAKPHVADLAFAEVFENAISPVAVRRYDPSLLLAAKARMNVDPSIVNAANLKSPGHLPAPYLARCTLGHSVFAPAAFREQLHRGLACRLVASARAYVGFVRANVAEYDITEVCHRSRGRFVIRCPILA
jgi:hypothetical protein